MLEEGEPTFVFATYLVLSIETIVLNIYLFIYSIEVLILYIFSYSICIVLLF